MNINLPRVCSFFFFGFFGHVLLMTFCSTGSVFGLIAPFPFFLFDNGALTIYGVWKLEAEIIGRIGELVRSRTFVAHEWTGLYH